MQTNATGASSSISLTQSGGSLPTPHADGVGPSTPTEQSRSRRESAKALAAAHDRIELHRRTHAAWALPCKSSGTSRTFAEAKPPTSPASTTKRALPPSPTSSGKRASFRRLATLRQTPLVVAVRGFASPSTVKGQTSVVSTANCAPWKRGSPSTTTSSLRVPNWSTHQDPGHGRRRSFVPSLQPLGRFLQLRLEREDR